MLLATKQMTLLDAPGHKDYIPKMIAGAAQADVAMLVVPASIGEFEAAFENSGQTKEHTILVRSLGVKQLIVAVNKMDVVSWNQDRFKYITNTLMLFLQKTGFKREDVTFIPVSGLSGINLTKGLPVTLLEGKWYTGSCLVQAIDNFVPATRPVNKPFRFGVSDVFKSMNLGHAVSGRIYTGAIQVGDKVLLMPLGERVTIKGIERNGLPSKVAGAGDHVEMGVTGIDPVVLKIGSTLCSIAQPITVRNIF